MRQYTLNGSEATSVSSPRRMSKSGVRHLSLILLFLLTPLLGHGGTESASRAAHEYRLRLYHTHTGERLDVVYRRGGQYIPEALDDLDHFLRDHRTGDVRHFDPRLFDLLYDLTASLAWRSTAYICRPKRSTFAYLEFRRWSCVTRPCACIAEEWGTIAAPTLCTWTSGVCAIGSCCSTLQ
jgi:hypothetical protein